MPDPPRTPAGQPDSGRSRPTPGPQSTPADGGRSRPTPAPPSPPADGAAHPRTALAAFGERLRTIWRLLDPEQRLAAGGAIGLVLSFGLPWYEALLVRPRGAGFDRERLTALGAFSFVEAAILLVALGVLTLLYARAHQRPFHLPGGDGTVLAATGAWTVLLLVWRLFDKPDVGTTAAVGVAWGIFVALAMGALLVAAGLRARATHRPEPGQDDEFGWEARPPRRKAPATAPREPTGAVAEALAQRPTWEGEVPEAPGRADPPPPTEPPRTPPTDRLF